MVNMTSATLSLAPPPPQHRHGLLLGYNIQVSNPYVLPGLIVIAATFNAIANCTYYVYQVSHDELVAGEVQQLCDSLQPGPECHHHQHHSRRVFP